jgi:predicted RNA-binding Zn-ribbon protein involved in translation (DUF1610 family)
MSDDSVIVRPDGQPARQQGTNCPRCGKGEDMRVKSASFGGEPHDVCGYCGFEEFERSAE